MKPGTWLGRVSGLVLLVLLAGCATTPSFEDSPENRAEQAQALARLFVEAGSFERVLDDGADLGRDYSVDSIELELGRELTPEDLERVRSIMRAALSEVLSVDRWSADVAEILAEHFTAPELQSIRAFFDSPAGAKVIVMEAVLAEEVDARTDAAFDENLDAFISLVDQKLEEAFPELQSGDGE